MTTPTLNDVAAMSSTDFAMFAGGFKGEAHPLEDSVDAPATVVPEVTTETNTMDVNGQQQQEEPSATIEVDGDAASQFYQALTAPIKAAGKELSFTDPEEIRTLIQKGIGYTKKMGQLNKFQRHMETLDKENLLNDNTLNLIIDLARGKPEALKQYIESNKVDVYNIIGLDASNYQPEKHIPSEDEYESDQLVQEVKSTEGYELIQGIAEKDWDEESRQKLFADPELARNIIAAAKAGIHEMVLVEAEKVKLLASQPISDLQAYIEAGTKLHKQGAFDKMTNKSSNVSTTIQPQNVSAHSKQSPRTTKPSSVNDLLSMDVEALRKFAAENNL